MEEKASGEAFGEAFLKQESGRAQEEGADFTGCIRVPESLDLLAPAPDFLDFVEDQPHGTVTFYGFAQGCVPMHLDPLGAWGQSFVCAGIVARPTASRGGLFCRSCFTNLPRADQNLQAWRGNGFPTQNLLNDFSFKHIQVKCLYWDRDNLLNQMSNFTQWLIICKKKDFLTG
jgi:hypothetical protein